MGGSSRPGLLDFPQRLFVFVCFLVRASVTLQPRPTFFMFQTGDGLDESPPASLAVCFVVFFRTRIQRTCQILFRFFVRFRHSAAVVVVFFVLLF